MPLKLPAACLLVALVAACDAGGPDSAASPSAVPQTPAAAQPAADLTTLLKPPAALGAPRDTGPAATALLAAARKIGDVASLRTKIRATVRGNTPERVAELSAVSEAESPARYQFNLSLSAAGKTSTSEAIAYDGRNWSRNNGGAWQPTIGSSAFGPHAYVNFLNGANSVVDAGVGDRNGVPSERYTAAVALSGPSASSPSQLTAFVDRASGRLIGEDVVLSDPSTSSTTMLAIDFYDFGVTIKITPP